MSSKNPYRHRKRLAKLLGCPKELSRKAVILIRNPHISTDSATGHFVDLINNYLEDEESKRRLELTIKRENPVLSEYKTIIIELYNSGGKGLGYSAIKKYLKVEMTVKKDKRKVPSPTTIMTYLHEKWGVEKDLNRHKPKAAIVKRNENRILNKCMFPKSQIDDLIEWILTHEKLQKSQKEEVRKRILYGEKTGDRFHYQNMMVAKGYDKLDIMMSEDKVQKKYKELPPINRIS